MRARLALFAFVGLVVGSGCEGPQFRKADVGGIRVAGELRVAARPGLMQSPARTVSGLDQLGLAQRLAAELGVELRTREATRNDQLLPWLIQGRVDVVMCGTPLTGVDESGVVRTAPLGWADDLVLRTAGARGLVGNGPLPVHLHRSNALWDVLAGDPGLRLFPVPEEVSAEELTLRVAAGRYAGAVSDSELVADTGVGGAVEIEEILEEQRPIVWLVRRDSPQLRSLIDDFLFAEQVLLRGASEPVCHDLEGVLATRRLRLVTRNSPTTCTVAQGGLTGFEYDLARRFARGLGVRLELSLPPAEHDALDWLEEGRGDLAALHEPVPPNRGSEFLATEVYRRVDLVLMRRKIDVPIDEGLRVAASEATADLISWLDAPINGRRVPLQRCADPLEAAARVRRGDVDAAVIDSDLARLETAEREVLEVADTVVPNAGLTWVANTSAPELVRRASSFLRSATRNGTVRLLEQNRLNPGTPRLPARLPDVPKFALTPWDAELKRAALETGIDWRLLASLMYEESRFDPDAIGPGGSAGLFQFMPATWRWLGIEDPLDPEEAIPSAASYLRLLMDEFDEIQLRDRVAMGLASYNVGPRHVIDARRLAAEMGLDPDRWTNGVETAMLVLDDSTVARRYPAGVCRCRRAVNYTRRILRRYHLYTQQFR